LSNLENLEQLSLSEYFKQHLNIPNGITKLVINCNIQSIIDYLPSSIVELELGYSFNLELNDLPSSIKKIKIDNWNYSKKLNNLPNLVEYLEITKFYKLPVDAKYKNLKIVYY